MHSQNNTVVAVIARTGSSRLPNKVLARLGPATVLEWVIGRSMRASNVDQVVVATSDSPNDDVLARHCEALGVSCFRGDEHDVLGRLAAAAEAYDAQWIVRVNADCPFIDPVYIDMLITRAAVSHADYIGYETNSRVPVMLTPIGVFPEAVSRSCLIRAENSISDRFLREHVTLGIYSQPEEFEVLFLPIDADFEITDLRLTLDTSADLRNLNALVREVGPNALQRGALAFARAAIANKTCLQIMRQQNKLNVKDSQPSTQRSK